MSATRARFPAGGADELAWTRARSNSSIGLFLREDLGRGDITTQSVLARNARARGRFVAAEKMIVAGLEAAEEVFITLDPQQQLEAFASDGEEVEAGKVIAAHQRFAEVLLAGERVALNLLQHLSGVATVTRQFVRAVEGTNAKIADTRKNDARVANAGEVRCVARRWRKSSLRTGRWRPASSRTMPGSPAGWGLR